MSGVAGQFHGAERIGGLETERSRWLAIAVFSVLGVTLFRIICLAFDRTDLFVDEAQYCFGAGRWPSGPIPNRADWLGHSLDHLAYGRRGDFRRPSGGRPSCMP